MRIENLLFNNINLNNSDNILKEGSLFKGEILEMFEEFVLIDILGHGIIKATSEGDIDLLLGSEINFLVKSNEDGQIKIKALENKELTSPKTTDKVDNSISKILSKLNIAENKLSVDLVENLMKYNAPINEKNILEGIKVLEKLIELISLESDDKVVNLENKSINENRIILKNEIIYKGDLKLSKDFLDINTSENVKTPEKTNIKNLLIVDRNSYPEKEDLSSLVRETLGNEIGTDIKEFNKILGFFIKNNIKPSLNNIKNLSELIKDPIEFSKAFVKLNTLLKEFTDNEGHNLNFKKLEDSIMNIHLNKKTLETSKENMELLQEVIEKTDNKITSQTNLKKEFDLLENKIDFLKEMDKDLSFLFLPINYGEKELDGVLTLLKEDKSKKILNDKINIFINLDTNNLGNIKIFCLARQEVLTIKLNIKKSDLKLFKLAEQGLIDRIASTGYIANKIEFIVDEDLNIMDMIITNPDPKYFLDIKV